MMTDAQRRAWECLKPQEQQSLFLQTSEGKSSWEAGGIMQLSHYKYIEIRERSEKFFRMFMDFFERRTAIFRPDCPCERNFQDFIEGVIERRLPKKEARVFTGDSAQQLPTVNSKNIIRNMGYLKESDNPWDIDTRKLIFEFDRWNNFRIFPAILQQPSAFKRRINKKDKIYIKYLLNRVPQFVLERVKERFYYKVKPSIKKYWVCLISNDLYTDGYYLLPIRPNEEVIKEMSRLYMYVFDNREDADTFGFLVSRYRDKTVGVQYGQKFWPEYRYVTKRAVNYNAVNNIEFNVRQLDMAYNTNKSKNKKKKHPKKTGEHRVEDPKLFYKNK